MARPSTHSTAVGRVRSFPRLLLLAPNPLRRLSIRRESPPTQRMPTGSSSKPPHAAGEINMTRILAVDDSPAMRQMVSVTLRGAGYDVLEAFDGREALDIA